MAAFWVEMGVAYLEINKLPCLHEIDIPKCINVYSIYTDPSKCINDHTLRSNTEFCRTSLLKLSDKILPGRSESLHSQIVKL